MGEVNILVVEDESIISMDIQARLKKLGYNVAAAVRTGAAAIEFIKNNHADLVLMDIMLEGNLDGIDTASEILQIHSLPIIYLTAYADDATLQRAKLNNTFGYILKPFNDNDLRIAIDMGLHRNKTETEEKSRRQVNTGSQKDTQSIAIPVYSLRNDKKRIPVWTDDELIVLNPSDVYYLEINMKNVYIHTKSETYTTRGTLKEWEDKLIDHNFFRCHKCYLVNTEKIQKLITCLDNSSLIKLVDLAETIPLSRYRLQSLKDEIII